MKTTGYLIINRYGQLEIRKRKPTAVPTNAVAVRLDIEIPDTAFGPIIPTITLDIQPNQIIPPAAIPSIFAHAELDNE